MGRITTRLVGISRGQGIGLPNLLGARRGEPEQVRESDRPSTQAPQERTITKPLATIVLVVAAALLLTWGAPAAAGATTTAPAARSGPGSPAGPLDRGHADVLPVRQAFVADQILVRFRPAVSAARVDRVLADQRLSRIRRIPAIDVHVLQLPPGLAVEQAVRVLDKLPEVAYAEPNYVLHTLAPARQIVDALDQWALAKIQAPQAWRVITDTAGEHPPTVLLATVDTGIDRTHPDLAANVWQNPGEIADNGIDDDGNGYVDDTWGWDFRNDDNDPFDDQMHGTLVSSVAAGVQDGQGVAGVCPWCELAAVKVLGADGSGSIDAVANGIIYAADIGARVINLSLGATVNSRALENAVDHAWEQGALVVAGAGNNGRDELFYPGAYDNAMAIASTNEQDYHSCFSNYGEGFISVAAPGQAIIGALPDGEYGAYSGTSLATPHVTGLAGLLFSQVPTRTHTDVRTIIEATAEDLGSTGTDPFFGSGRINAYRAVTGDVSPTIPPTGLFSDDLTASGYAHARKLARDAGGNLHLVWHGGDGGQRQVLYATSGDGGESWSEPQVVFHSDAETYHPAMAADETAVYVAFPSRHGSGTYRTLFTRKPLSGGAWLSPTVVLGGSYDAVRPDLYLDPATGRLHLVAASMDDVSYVTYAWSDDGGTSWSAARQIAVGQGSRYASVHAFGSHVTVVGRTVEFIWLGLVPRYRVFAVRSPDGGDSWSDPAQLAIHTGLFRGEYGASLAGVGDRLYLSYEHQGRIYLRRSADGVVWSDPEDLGTGAWPSVTQAADGRAWVMWERDGELLLRHHTGFDWEEEEALGQGNYPNLALGTAGGMVGWAATHCNGGPFRLTVGQIREKLVVAASVAKSVAPSGPARYGDELTYTLAISAVPGTRVGLYDPLTDTTFQRFVGPATTITHTDRAITGTLTVTPGNRTTVEFVAQVGVPGTAGWAVTVTNRACVYPPGGMIDDCVWSNRVANSAFRPYNIYLPLMLRPPPSG